MREIKFRAKPNMAYFFESDNVPTTDGFVFGTPDTRMLNVPGAEKWRKGHEMVDQPSIVAMTRDGWPTSVAVQEETVGEFSGLQDKAGRDIYEGDIVRWDKDQKLYVVVFRSGMFYASVEPRNSRIYGGFPLWCLCEEEQHCTIVGNRYDNPELIKAKKV